MKRNNLFSLILMFLKITAGLVTTSTNISSDQSTLLTIKSHLNLDPSHIMSINWSIATHVCSWIGVTCGSRHQRVIGLDMSTMSIRGSLPPQLSNLTFLHFINLSNNNFYGNMSRELTYLRRLRVIDFSINNLAGDIPSWFGLFSKLHFLNLGNNSFTGFIPHSLSNISNLEYLNLSGNTLQGEIPKEMGDILSIKILILRNNQLSGSIPSTLFNISTMERLSLSRNNLYGNLPDNICSGISKLGWLVLSWNQLYGEIPTNISNCLMLRTLSLSYNGFSGSIPREIENLRSLELLYLGENNFTGEILDDLSNITMLRSLDLQNNHFTGSITEKTFNISSLQYINLSNNNLSSILPPNMCSHLKQLQEFRLKNNNIFGQIPNRVCECSSLLIFDVAFNKLSGSIPREVGNLTLLRVLGLTSNSLTGEIPQEIKNLYNLKEIYLSENIISGSIPTCVFNISTLSVISLAYNYLEGDLPSDMGRGLPNLEYLFLTWNDLVFASPELSFITSLTNCRYLKLLSIGKNLMNVALPSSIGNFSNSLQTLYANDCGLRGRIPDEIGNLSSLIQLNLEGNEFTGPIPNTLENLQSLQGLFLGRNNINGTILRNICELQNLETLGLNENRIFGSIPLCIGSITTLRYLYLQTNKLDSTIPQSLWQLTDVLELNLSSNSLTGNLSAGIGNLKSVNVIDLSVNRLSGSIPSSIGDLRTLSILNFSNNKIQGSIPESITRIVNLMSLDLSQNNLSGVIPLSVENLIHLEYFNVSFNNLSGEIPSHGPFINFTSQSFMFNKGLCGNPRYNVALCPKIGAIKRKPKLLVILIIVGTSSFTLVIMILAYGYARRKTKNRNPNESPITTPSRISYYEILQATEGYSERNLIGRGNFGSVYRGVLKSGKVVAVKVFHPQTDDTFDSFEVECEVLRNLRHKNLCKVIGCCSNADFKALILEYMPSGSLEKLLYSDDNVFLDLVERMSIMIDVASALEYLHYGYSSTIIHCDIKPSNILVDEHMVAHLCDFGMSKLLGDGETSMQIITLATLGYIAPEFGTDGRLSTRCDVYSYGIMLIEVLTGIKPSDETFTGNFSLRTWVESYMPDGIIHIIDINLLKRVNECSSEKLNCLHSIMDLALRCSSMFPHERISIKDVNVSLKKIKNQLLAGHSM